ncbi:MAG: VWA domain-containing protein, partial [Candidatus Eisenbacteria sp.]|nr:VWA domain-containing protein [Candidatus Eisenbacteria bacterium]
MRFAHPHILWLLLLLPVVGLFAWARLRAGSRALERALSPGMSARLTQHLATGRRMMGLLLLLLTCLFLILGAARPQRGTQYVKASRRGIDVLIALDLSESMLAEDLKPNRLLRARHEIGGIIDRLRGDRIGLVAFAGAAFVQCPLTLDYAAARMFLEFMGPDLIPEPGTSLAEALRVSTRAFDSDGDEFKALILISDGEDHAGEVEEAAREARRAGVRVFSVGIGSASGEPIPVRDSEGSIEGYKKDKSGKIILTRLNDDSLRRIAESTRGLYVRAGGTLGLDRVMKAIDQMDKKELEGGIRVLYEERYSYFLWPAIVLLLAQWWIPLRRRPKRGSGLSAPLLLCIALL